jgi:hypothetical protein
MKTEITVIDILKIIKLNSNDFDIYQHKVNIPGKIPSINTIISIYDKTNIFEVYGFIRFIVLNLNNIDCTFTCIEEKKKYIKTLTTDEREYFLLKFSNYL